MFTQKINSLLISVITLISLSFTNFAFSQLSSPVLVCSAPIGGPPFTVKLNGATAEVVLKSNRYYLNFKDNWVTKSGDKMTTYVGGGLEVNVVGSEKYVQIRSLAISEFISTCFLN